ALSRYSLRMPIRRSSIAIVFRRSLPRIRGSPVKKTLICVALTATVGALVATTIDFDRFERRQPGEGRRESRTRYSKVGNAGDESAEAKIRDEQFAEARTAPGVILPGAYSAAFASLSGLPVSGGSWNEVTNRPYNADDPR